MKYNLYMWAERPKYPGVKLSEMAHELTVVGRVMYFPSMYVGNPDSIERLAKLAETPEFLAQYPDHHVHAVDEEIIAAVPRHVEGQTTEQYFVARASINMLLDEMGISAWNCALIQTGRRREITLGLTDGSDDALGGNITISSIP